MKASAITAIREVHNTQAQRDSVYRSQDMVPGSYSTLEVNNDSSRTILSSSFVIPTSLQNKTFSCFFAWNL